jgi:hypothetical protein
MLICNAITKKTLLRCTHNGKFIVGDHTYCGKHKPKDLHTIRDTYCKNSLRSRLSSTQYACAITVFKTFEHSIKQRIVSNNPNDLYISNSSTPDSSTFACFYCECDLTNKSRAEDHMLPVIVNKKPNIKYFRAHNNTVQCCVPCNTSKGNRPVLTWMSTHLNPLINNHDKIQKVTHRIASIPDVPSDIYAHMLCLFNTFMTNHEQQIRILENLH